MLRQCRPVRSHPAEIDGNPRTSIWDLGAEGPVLWQVLVFAVSVATIFVLAAALLVPVSPGVVHLLILLDGMICAVFFADFVVQMVLAPDRWRYFRVWGWLDLLSSIPVAAEPLRWGRLARVIRILRLLRALRTTGVRVRDLVANPAHTALFTLGVATILTLSIASSLVLIAEEKAEGRIDNAGDALWWCMATMTTVGYGDFVPVTPAGRIIAACTMVVGIALFGIFTALVTSLLSLPGRHQDHKTIHELQQRLDRIENLLERIDKR